MDNILDTFRSYFNSASFGSEYLQSCLPKRFRKALVSQLERDFLAVFFGNFVSDFLRNFLGTFLDNSCGDVCFDVLCWVFLADFMDTFQSYFNSASFGSEYLQSC